jgi:cation transport ATPase
VAEQVANKLNIGLAYGGLLPEGKAEKVQALKAAGRRKAL